MALSKLVASFLSAFMSVVIAFNGISISVPFFADTAETEYVFANEKAGSAAGTVTVESKIGGTYKLFWGDENGEKLFVDVKGMAAYYSEFATVRVSGGEGSAEIISFTAIPEGAETVLTVKNGMVADVTEIPENKIADFGTKEYSFGALSDLHFNRYNGSLSGDDATITFPNALNFIEGFGVELVGMSGDISADGERDAFEKFNTISSAYGFPVYTCTGNHDVSDDYTLANWQELVNAGVYGETKKDGVKAVSDNGLDFVYAPEKAGGDAFIFLSQYQWSYGDPATSRILTDEQLNWLEAQLETYKDRSVFLFFHTFLANAEGEPMMGEGNLLTEKGHHYDLVFTPGAPDEIRFRGMMEKYENVVFFNGHSHWAYAMQEINPQLNITDHNGTYATMVHLSSVSSPRTTKIDSDDTDENYMRKSEGMIVTVYDDCIVFTACDFLRGQLLAYATYVVEK
ncbi:MAG: metallophosphoesterase family protein [Clostridia bacterium]|nr:metallophosphoesterase family protein [Clostridia bacterium]